MIHAVNVVPMLEPNSIAMVLSRLMSCAPIKERAIKETIEEHWKRAVAESPVKRLLKVVLVVLYTQVLNARPADAFI